MLRQLPLDNVSFTINFSTKIVYFPFYSKTEVLLSVSTQEPTEAPVKTMEVPTIKVDLVSESNNHESALSNTVKNIPEGVGKYRGLLYGTRKNFLSNVDSCNHKIRSGKQTILVYCA